MGKSPTKTPDIQANHLFAAIPAYGKLEALKLRHGLGYFAWNPNATQRASKSRTKTQPAA